jgi:putative oxidoreductase
MIKKLLSTNNSPLLLLLRSVLGIVMFAHGAQKMLGIWGGHGVQETLDSWEKWFNLHPVVTFLVILSEFVGGIFLILGFMTRLCAIATLTVMTGAVYLAKHYNHFYMNWYAEPRGEGFEYHLLVASIAISLTAVGGGKFSVDRAIANRIRKRNGQSVL